MTDEELKQNPPPLGEVLDFLYGKGPLDGVWFGDLHPTRPGRYWWRGHLRAAIAAAAIRSEQ